MPDVMTQSFVQTIGERCRVCYTCVRECPAKAIRISGGQAEILPERCICCGHCVSVCSQGAKQTISTIENVERILESQDRTIACVAPSAAAEFADVGVDRLIGMVRALGFHMVCEVSFGADLVSDRYGKLLKESGDKRSIATSCPALVAYVEKHHPVLAQYLAPIVSPMVATARALRFLHGEDVKVVFIGPCIAKKKEAISRKVMGDIDEVITFAELRSMFEKNQITSDMVEPSDFDPPHSRMGMLYPITRGFFQAADIQDDILENNFIATGGSNFVEVLREFNEGVIEAKLLEILCCDGCMMGPGMSVKTSHHERRSLVSRYARERLEKVDEEEWKKAVRKFDLLDLSREYEADDKHSLLSVDEESIKYVLFNMGKKTVQDELNCGACGYDSCRDHAIAILMGLAESEMCLPYTIEKLKDAYKVLSDAHNQLARTRAALEQAEKMASLGQLAAGIAHEINNPLGVVLMYSHMLYSETSDQNLREDLHMIVEQADRCKKIVSDLLQFARKNKVTLKTEDLYKLVVRTIEQMHLPNDIEVEFQCASSDPIAEVDSDQVIQIITNMVNNAVDAMPTGGRLTLAVDTVENDILLKIKDTGTGIPPDKVSKIFEPFYTTKQMGKGTGLGLAVSYGIVKMHRGNITVVSNTNKEAGPTGTTFTIRLPRKGLEEQAPIGRNEEFAMKK